MIDALEKLKNKILGTSLERKTKVLILNTTIGLFLITFTTISSLFGLKYDYDSSILNQEQKLKQLIVIQSIYADLLAEYIQTQSVAPNIKKLKIAWNQFNAIQEISNYGTRFKDFYASLFLDYTKQIQELSHSEMQIEKIINDEIPHETTHFEEFKVTALRLNSLLHRAIELRIEILNLKKYATDSLFVTTLIVVAILIIIIVLTTLFFSQIILSSIKNLHQSLEAIIFRKTKELRDLNSDLQKTIQKEVKESRQKDQIMYQQAKLASIGEMIQNIAHQWRQPLNALTLIIQGFKSKSENGKLTHEFICKQTQDALRMAKNMSDTIENFRNFYQPTSLKENFCIQKSIQDCLQIFHSNLKNYNISTHIASCEDYVYYGYENAFTQTILNLVSNAKDAIVLNEVSLGLIEFEISHTQEALLIQVRDNAGGIKVQDKEKIFEPYFTTKHKSLGTGIGLYMVKQIIERQMNGRISVENKEWQSKITQKFYYGAIFSIKLPYTTQTKEGSENE